MYTDRFPTVGPVANGHRRRSVLGVFIHLPKISNYRSDRCPVRVVGKGLKTVTLYSVLGKKTVVDEVLELRTGCGVLCLYICLYALFIIIIIYFILLTHAILKM